MMEEKTDLVKPVLFKFGVVLAISFASFMYSRFRIRNKRPSLAPPSSSSSGSSIQSLMLHQYVLESCISLAFSR